jgi:hypothetical protein
MWQRAHIPSRSDPGRETVCPEVPRSNFVTHSSAAANGLRRAFAVPSGGAGVAQFPSVDIWRADSRNAARQAGSRQAFAIIDPFHS